MSSLGGAEATIPRFSRRSLHGYSNQAAATTLSDAYRIFVSRPIVSLFLQELRDRFEQPSQSQPVFAYSLVPVAIWEKLGKGRAQFEDVDDAALHRLIDNIVTAAEPYATPLFTLSLQSLRVELRIWVHKWLLLVFKKQIPVEDLPANLNDLLHSPFSNFTIFPHVHRLVRIIATLPVKSCNAERVFSALRRLKTYSRSTMGDERLTCMLLCHIYYDFQFDLDKLCDSFASTSDVRKDKLII